MTFSNWRIRSVRRVSTACHRPSERLKSAASFHACVASLVSELGATGHDLWSLDDSDEMEMWGPNYETPTGPGIVVTFRPDVVSVEWSR